MDKNQIYLLVTLVSFATTIVISVWLTKRAQPEKRIHWFIGCSLVTLVLLGIYAGPVAIISIIGLLAIIKKEDDRPLSDVRDGILVILGSGFGVVMYGFFILLGVGGIYWLWLAIQLKSFSMFLVGMFPLAYIVTAPVGAYSLIFETPQWVIDVFG